MKTRQERERELMELAASGRQDELVRILKQHRGLSPGQTLPVGTPLIAEILNHEYGESKE